MDIGWFSWLVRTSLVWVLAIDIVSSEHWLCALIECPTDALVYETKPWGISLGYGFQDVIHVHSGFSAIRCAAFCRTRKCAFMATNGDGCAISGLEKDSSTGPFQNFVKFSLPSLPSPSNQNLCLNKPVISSSIRAPISGFVFDPSEVNDDEFDNAKHFFHSSAGTDDINPWIRLDCGSQLLIQKVAHIGRLSSNARIAERSKRITFYLGSVDVTDGKFKENNYEEIRFYEGPYDGSAGTFDEYTLPTPKFGRYLGIAKEDSYGDKFVMEITEVRVV